MKRELSSREQKRVNSATKYVDALLEENSKLLLVRDDLYIKEPFKDSCSAEDVSKLFDKMLNNRRSKPTIFEDNVGYISKLEYTQDRGAHLHTIFLFNGNNVQKDAHKAKQIGEYWCNEITQGKGSYNNCNLSNYKKNHAIGMIDYTDIDKIELLKNNVIPYLAKDEQDVKDAASTDVVAFRRGLMPKKRDVKMGRPRKIKDVKYI